MSEVIGFIGLGNMGEPMPLASMLHDRFLSAMAKGRDDLDWTAMALGASEDAGLYHGASRAAGQAEMGT